MRKASKARWKGDLRLDSFVCPVELHAVHNNKRLSTQVKVNRRTRNPIKYRYVDQTGQPIPRRYYDGGTGETIQRGDWELVVRYCDGSEEDTNPGTTIEIESFKSIEAVDVLYLGESYYVVPKGKDASYKIFSTIRDAIQAENVVGFGSVKFKTGRRSLMLRPRRKAMIATVLRHEVEIHAEAEYFANLPDVGLSSGEVDHLIHFVKQRASEPCSTDSTGKLPPSITALTGPIPVSSHSGTQVRYIIEERSEL